MVLLLAGLAAPGCRKREAAPPPAPLEVLAPRLVVELGTPVRCGALHPGGLVAAGTEDGSVLLADARGKRMLGEPRLHAGPVAALQFSSDGKHLLSGGGQLAVWWATADAAPASKVRGPQQITAALLRETPAGAVAYFGTALGSMVRWPVHEKAAQPMRELACTALPVPAERRGLAEAERCAFGTFVAADDGSGAACVYPVTALALAGKTLWRGCREGSLYGEELEARRRWGFSVGYLHAIAPRRDGVLVLARDEGELRLFDPSRGEVVGELRPAGAAQLANADGALLAVALDRRVRLYLGRSLEPSAEFDATGRVVALAVRAAPMEVRTLTAEGRAEVRPLRASAKRAP